LRMTGKKRLALFFSVVLAGLVMCPSLAQDSPVFSNFYRNPFLFNPAYAGFIDQQSVSINHRRQWLGIEGAPVSTIVSFHGPVNQKISVGANLINDTRGPLSTNTALLTFGYGLLFSSAEPGHRLNFGLSLGGGTNSIDFNDFSDALLVDPVVLGALDNTSFLDGAFGMHYQNGVFNLGVSLPSIFERQIAGQEGGFSQPVFQPSERYIVNASAAIIVADGWEVEPHALLRGYAEAPMQVEVMAVVHYNSMVRLGGSFRSGYGPVVVLGASLPAGLDFNYAYEPASNQVNNPVQGTHEIGLAYRWGDQKRSRKENSFIASRKKRSATSSLQERRAAIAAARREAQTTQKPAGSSGTNTRTAATPTRTKPLSVEERLLAEQRQREKAANANRTDTVRITETVRDTVVVVKEIIRERNTVVQTPTQTPAGQATKPAAAPRTVYDTVRVRQTVRDTVTVYRYKDGTPAPKGQNSIQQAGRNNEPVVIGQNYKPTNTGQPGRQGGTPQTGGTSGNTTNNEPVVIGQGYKPTSTGQPGKQNPNTAQPAQGSKEYINIELDSAAHLLAQGKPQDSLVVVPNQSGKAALQAGNQSNSTTGNPPNTANKTGTANTGPVVIGQDYKGQQSTPAKAGSAAIPVIGQTDSTKTTSKSGDEPLLIIAPPAPSESENAANKPPTRKHSPRLSLGSELNSGDGSANNLDAQSFAPLEDDENLAAQKGIEAELDKVKYDDLVLPVGTEYAGEYEAVEHAWQNAANRMELVPGYYVVAASFMAFKEAEVFALNLQKSYPSVKVGYQSNLRKYVVFVDRTSNPADALRLRNNVGRVSDQGDAAVLLVKPVK